jgi:hypothetical protein
VWNAGADLVLNEKPDAPDVSSTETVNPNAKVPQWSYGYRETSTGSQSDPLVLFTAAQHTNAAGGSADLEGYTGPAGFPYVTANVGASQVPFPNLGTINANEMFLHPANGGDIGTFAVIRWTAPASGEYDVTAAWRDLDSNGGDGVEAFVVLNGAAVPGGSLSYLNGGSATYPTTRLNLTQNDTLDFVLGPGANGVYGNDSTAFNATITSVPEPGIGLATIVGFAGACLNRRRR